MGNQSLLIVWVTLTHELKYPGTFYKITNCLKCVLSQKATHEIICSHKQLVVKFYLSTKKHYNDLHKFKGFHSIHVYVVCNYILKWISQQDIIADKNVIFPPPKPPTPPPSEVKVTIMDPKDQPEKTDGGI
mgnify:CR=1 FL=1